MERYKKKDMLQTVDMLIRANDAVTRTAASNPQGAGEALVQCQESAIVLGTYIDTLGKEYASLVGILEDYCENIYQMNENLADENLCRKVSKKIQKQLTGLHNGIKYDMPEDRKEVVFLPYKASMWDSLESVWKAADADENTDAYVIPIPYFDKNPDGSFREEHYEGDLYPKYVPITRYDEYDLEMRRPDVIYIHNPYDECNHVTSVHPYFYSKNLRNFTDRLVYIPYFILGEIEPDDQEAVDGMKHFCFMPGTIYADRVIVQSEKMRQIYINEYMKASKEMGLSGEHLDREFLGKKFLGLGSPKIDKVLNTKREDLEVPAEWLKVIKKPDGSWKKIVFYNTSVSALLHYDEKMLRKMKSVFKIFKENRDKVALLWRPHPLIQATIESMRPQLQDGYKEIRDRYLEEGWGIYDDSADMNRAIVLSDAYYGDRSSVVELYKKTGKLIIGQDVEKLSKTENILLSTWSMVHIGKNVYFATKNLTGFFRYDKQTEKIELIATDIFTTNDIFSKFVFGGVCVYKENILFAPYLSSSLLIYNIPLKKVEIIDISRNSDMQLSSYCVKRMIVSENLVYFVSDVNREMLFLNMDTMKIKVFDSWRRNFFKNTGIKDFVGINTGGDVCIVENSFWVPLNFDNYILEVDMKNQKTNFYKINCPKMRFSTICFDGEDFWLTGYKPVVVKWNKKEECVEILDEFPNGFLQFHKEGYWEEVFSRSFYEQGYIYLFPLTANMVLKIKKETGQMEKIYQWDSLESCYTVEKWDENLFYVETGNRNYIDINDSMLIDINGAVIKRNIFNISEMFKSLVFGRRL